MSFSITGNLVDIQNRKIYKAEIIVKGPPQSPEGGKVYAPSSLLEEICTNNENFKKWS